MKHLAKWVGLILGICFLGLGQVPIQNWSVGLPPMANIIGITYSNSSNSGTSLWYWVTSDYVAGSVLNYNPASVGGVTSGDPAPGSPITVSFNSVNGPTSYSVLRTSTATPPSFPCSCLVGSVSGGVGQVVDTGSALQAFSPTLIKPVAGDIRLNNTEYAVPTFEYTINGVTSPLAPIQSIEQLAGGRTVFVGDSITADYGWPIQLSILSNAKVLISGNVAVGGYTCAQALTTMPTAIALHPDKIMILCGTNDMSGVAQTISDITAMVTQAISAGTVPIIATIPPRNNVGSVKGILQLNIAIKALARSLRIPLVDFYSALTGTDGQYITNYSSDGVHPTPMASRLMAQKFLADAGYLYNESPIFLGNSDGDGANLVTNPLFLSYSTSSVCNSITQPGVPFSWAGCGNTGSPAIFPTQSIVTGDTAISGNWYQVVIPAGTGGYWSMGSVNETTGWAAGDCIAASGRLKISGLETSGGGYLYIYFNGVTALYQYKADVTNGIFYFQGVIPAGATSQSISFQIFQGPSSPITVSFAQIGIFNLTAAGQTGCTL